jgi:hypothetical protein
MINFSKLAALAKATPKKVETTQSSLDELAQERMSRRAALRRIGMTGAMTVIGVMSIDDLARVAAKKLEQNELTRGIASDFKDSGVAFAAPGLSTQDTFATPDDGLTEKRTPCDCYCECDKTYAADVSACGPRPLLIFPTPYTIAVSLAWKKCIFDADTAHDACNLSCMFPL